MSAETFTRMVLSSDYTITREGLRSLFQQAPEIKIIGEAKSMTTTPNIVRELVPDVVLMEISVPERASGLRAVAEITDHLPETQVVVLTNNGDLAYARTMLACGVSGYLLKNSTSSQLFAAVRNVTRGRKIIDATLGNDLLWHKHGKKPKSARPTFSHRELEVLRALIRGYTNTQAAELLKVSVKTVETYRLRLYRKLNVRSRAELVEYAAAHPLLMVTE
jgi:two-component system response regulator NreC